MTIALKRVHPDTQIAANPCQVVPLQICGNDDLPTTMSGMAGCTESVKMAMECTMLKVGTIITEKIEFGRGNAGGYFKIAIKHAPGHPM